MAYLTADGERRIYYEHNPAGDLTVALSHGWGMSCRVWDNTTARLQDAGYGVLAYDHRNCGASDKDFADVSIEALGADLANLCEHLNLSRVVLSGWSLGGAVAVAAAARMPQLSGLVLTCGATPRYTQAEGFPYGGQAQDVADTVAALRADRVNFLKGLYFDAVFARDVGDDVKNWCWQIALQASPGADASLAALATIDQRDAMSALDCPTLVVVGGQDGVVAPEIGRFAAAHTKQARSFEMADCGHAPFLEEPDSYHEGLLGFLAEVRAS